MNKRPSLAIVLGLVFAGTALVAGCGGGSHSPAVPATGSVTANAPASNATAPPGTAQVQVTVKLPTRHAPAARSKRSPKYVSPTTAYIGITASPSGTVGNGSCVSNTCTGSIFAPLSTTSLTVNLYDQNSNILASGTQAVTITPGIANVIPMTFNGYALTLQATAPPAFVVIGVPSTFTVTLTLLDLDGNQIVAPGNVLSTSGNLIITGDGTTTNTITLNNDDPADFTVGALTWDTSLYQFTGQVSYNGGSSASQVDLTPVTSVGITNAFGVTVPIVPQQLSLVQNPGVPIPTQTAGGGLPLYQISNTPGISSIELGTPPYAGASPGPELMQLSVVANYPVTASNTVGLSGDTCTGAGDVDSTLGNAFASPPPIFPSGYQFSFNATASVNTNCQFVLTDLLTNVSTTTTLYFNQPSIFVQRKARK